MNTGQIIYALALAGVFLWRPGYAAWVLLANMAATLAACLALDFGMDRSDATLTMMLIDFIAGAALVVKPGLPRLLSVGYATTVPLYALNIVAGLSDGTTFAVVMAVGFIQIMVAAIGGDSNDRGNRRRRSDVGHSLSISVRSSGLGAGGMAQTAALLSQDRGGLK